MIGGPDSARWRTLTIMAAATLALMELWETYGYERTLNSRATRPTDIDFFYWRMQTRRGLQFAAFDALLGWLMWLSATNRFFVQPPSTLDKLGQACRSLEQGQICLSVAGDVRGAVAQNDGLRTKLAGFWDEERDVYQEQDVVNGTRAALSRADIQSLTTAAERRSHHIMGNALNQPGSPVKSL
ncbi:MAG: hypothetical protein M1828_002858 [Chrysothrix sp. TS-e1954]|nr:MAG: hypothetical protein M1828_002858 [Chrysothrix sp. TS-e1954]